MEVAFDAEKLTAIAIGLGFLASVLLFVIAIRRARRARRRQIEEAGEERPLPSSKPKRAALRPEDVVPEDEGAREKPHVPEPEPAAQAEPAEEPGRDAPAEPSEGEEPQAAKALATPGVLPAEKSGATPVAKAAAHALQPVPDQKPAPAAPLPELPVEKPVLEIRRKKRDARALAPGLAPTRAGWISRLAQTFAGKREIDPSLVEEIEKVLLTADIGVRTSQKLLEEIQSSLGRKELSDPAAVWRHLRKRSGDFLRNEAPPVDFGKTKPFVLLTIGVNGSGKTTTIGKLASKLREEGKSVLLAAGDTFRAAAAEQLEVWGRRVGSTVVRGKEGGDPSSVVFDSIKRATAEGIDVVIADTAGRLHTKTNLMDELQKVRRVAGKALEGAPHETWLVIDATSGQNAIAQARIFTEAMAVTGIVLTKLDGTAKGGVILGIADQLGIPVRYIGVGERVQDLREFDADEFVEALFEDANPS
jgi:fused signal recognition particle receptor